MKIKLHLISLKVIIKHLFFYFFFKINYDKQLLIYSFVRLWFPQSHGVSVKELVWSKYEKEFIIQHRLVINVKDIHSLF